MTRIEIINQLIKKFRYKTYIEIGVNNGECFFQIQADYKIAIDPHFKISSTKKIKKIFSNFSNINNHWYEKTSDYFFSRHHYLFAKRSIDIALIDGMHEYHFALRDADNCLKYLNDNGIILMHDCNPITENAASSFKEWEKRNFYDDWNGDVWKSVVHLRSLYKNINVFVLDTDYGIGIISKRPAESVLNFSPDQIEKLTLEDLNQNREEWLNLKPVSYFRNYFDNYF